LGCPIAKHDKLKGVKCAKIPIERKHLQRRTIDLLYKRGAQHYIIKPHGLSQFKKVISQALTIISQSPSTTQNSDQPLRKFRAYRVTFNKFQAGIASFIWVISEE